MKPQVIRTDDVLDVRDGDVRILLDAGLDYVARPSPTEEAVIRNAQDAAGLLVLQEPVTDAVLGALSNLKVVARFGVGLDTVDVEAATARGVRVVNVPDANTSEVAAHAFAMVMALVRRLPQLDATVRRGEWSYLTAGDGIQRIAGLKLGLLGYGRIGRLVAGYGRSVGFDVQVHDPHTVIEPGDVSAVVGLDELVATSDVLSLHVPLVPETAGIVGAEAIADMKPGAILVNVSRGGLVDEDALVRALHDRRLAGAGIDTFASEPIAPESPLLSAPGLIVTPHAAHYSDQSYRETIQRAMRDVVRVLAGEPPLDPVN